MSKQINVGGVTLGGGAPVSIQSMTNSDTRDAGATLAQIGELACAGCQIVRVTVVLFQKFNDGFYGFFTAQAGKLIVNSKLKTSFFSFTHFFS